MSRHNVEHIPIDVFLYDPERYFGVEDDDYGDDNGDWDEYDWDDCDEDEEDEEDSEELAGPRGVPL